MTTIPARYQSRPDGGLDCLDEHSRITTVIAPHERLAVLYRCDPVTGRPTAVELHGRETDVVSTWRKMWKPLALGTLAGGPDINAALRLTNYPASGLRAEALAMINAALSNDLAPDTLEAKLEPFATKGIDHGHHDPDGSQATR